MTAIRKPSLLIPLTMALFIMVMDETTTVIALSNGAKEMNPLGFHSWSGLINLVYFAYLSAIAILIDRRLKWSPMWIVFIPYICLGISAVVNNIMVTRLA
jgi:hypothetical protein